MMLGGLRARRRWAGLTAVTLVAGACSAQDPTAALEAPPQVRSGPDQTYLSLGRQLLATNEPALAMKAFNASMSADGITAEAMTGAGIAAQRQGLLNAARRYFERARDLSPRLPVVHNNLGVVLFDLKEYHAARAAFETALELSGGEDESVRENLERTEAEIALRGFESAGEQPGTPRVVRLGTDRFLITERPETETPDSETRDTEARQETPGHEAEAD